MMWDVLGNFLRWVFWGLVYLMVLMTALVLVVGQMPMPPVLKLGMFGVFVWGVVADVQHKRRPVSVGH